MKKLIAFLIAAFLLQQYATAQCGTANLASGQSTNASSSADAFSGPAMAVDGGATTPWKSGTAATEWIKVNLGQAYAICRVKLRWATDFYFATHYTIEVSSDDQNWTTFATVSGAANNNGDGGIDEITANATAQWVRVTCTQHGAAWANQYELFELEVYGGTIPPPNNPPTVSIVTPPNNVSILSGNVLIEASAADADGIQKVEFYEGTTLLGFDNTSPYQYTWNNPAAGQYVLTAKAYDNNSETTVSDPVNITITSSGASAWLLNGNVATNPATQFLGTTDQKGLVFKTWNNQRMTITADGQVLINTNALPADPDADLALAVKGTIWAKKLKITQTGWADFVFDSSYKLLPLDKVAVYIAEHKHLPDVPSAKQVEKEGISVGDNQAILLRKIEELTLYLIQQDQTIKKLQEEVKSLKKQ